MKYFYFHGYGSSPQAEKAEILRELLGKENVIAPDFNVSPEKIADLFKEIESEIMKYKGNVCIVGSSLGGLYALYMSSVTDCPVILLNPALFPMLTVQKVTREIGAEVLVQVQQLSLYAFEHYMAENVRVWLTNDELINHKELTEPYFYGRGVKELVYFPENKASGHVFVGFKEVFKEYLERK